MKAWRLLLLTAALSGLASVACHKPAASSAPFLGEWKLISDIRMDQAILKLSSDGSCSLTEEGRDFHYCRRDTGPDQQVIFHYGLFLPMNTASATVADDEMTLDFGDSASTYLDTLAAALARDNQFDRAVSTEEEALSLLINDDTWPDHEAVLGRFRNRLELYKAGQVYTEP